MTSPLIEELEGLVRPLEDVTIKDGEPDFVVMIGARQAIKIREALRKCAILSRATASAALPNLVVGGPDSEWIAKHLTPSAAGVVTEDDVTLAVDAWDDVYDGDNKFNAMHAALKTLPGVAWRPIETAPTDGTEVLLYERWCDTPFVGYYCTHYKVWSVDMSHVDGDGYGNVSQRDVTHWMPLPPPPTQGEK